MKAKINEVAELFREFVTTHDYKHTPILTAYVDVDPTKPTNQRTQPAWLIDLKNEAKRLEQELDSEQLKRRHTQVRWERTEEMVMAYLRNRKPTGRSIVLFSDMEDFIAVDLPVTLPTRLYYGFPQIKHLLFALDQHKKYLVILFSEAKARLVEVFLTRTTDEFLVETEHGKARQLGRKSMEVGQDRRKPEFKRRFVNEMAAEINRYFLNDPDSERLILGGNLKLAHAVKNGLHPAVKEMVVAIEPIDFKSSASEIAGMVKQIAESYEQVHDLTIIEELITLYHRSSAAVIEPQGVETALRRGQVKTLIIPYPIDAAQFDSLIVEAVISGAEVEFVFGEAADKLNEYGGVGAMLYYSRG